MGLVRQRMAAWGLTADMQLEVLLLSGQVTPQARPCGTAGPAA